MAESERTGLSHGAEVLVRRMAETASDDFHCDVLIVGSGYGGAVAAARLAGSVVDLGGGKTRPARIWLLERGLEYHPGTFPSRFSELAGHVRFNTQSGAPTRGRDEGLFDFRIGGDVSALLGNGLGGGSLINAGVMVEPDAKVFASGWPATITAEALKPAYQRALDMLQPETMAIDPSARWRGFEAVAKANGALPTHCPIAVNLGAARVNAVGVTLQPCTHCGDCVTGCNQGAKGTLDTNYLAWAAARKVEMFCGGAVWHVLRDEAKAVWNVTWHFTERTRRPERVGPFQVRARHVVLAAGSFGSTEILLRSQRAGLAMAGPVGSKFSTNGDLLVAGIAHKEKVCSSADQESDPADDRARSVGPTITGLVRVPQANGPLPIVAEEFAVPAALRRVFGEIAATTHALKPKSGPGDLATLSDESIDRCSLYGLMGDDRAMGALAFPDNPDDEAVEGVLQTRWTAVTAVPRGEQQADSGEPNPETLPSGVTSEEVFKRQLEWMNTGLKPNCDAEAPVVAHPMHVLGLGALTVHPLGGCPMADDATTGVVDACGRVFAKSDKTHGSLVVLDGAIVPRALGINPSLTIAALAEHALPQLMLDWDLIDPKAAPQPPPERRITRRQELPAASADWLIRERLHGPVSFGAWHGWIRLDISFAPIPGFAKALALRPRVAGIRQATLTLWDAPQAADPLTFMPDESVRLGSADLAGQVRLFEPNEAANEPPHRLVYQLTVQAVAGRAPMPLRVGSRLDGVKLFGQTRGQTQPVNLWRQLTEMAVRIDGGTGTGRLSLDLDDLADQREPLVRLAGLSNMPDALGDGAALLLYVLRLGMPTVHKLLFTPRKTIRPEHLLERWPGDLADCKAKDFPVGNAGTRLTRYALAQGTQQRLPPVVLIHGLGTSGSSFTHKSLPKSLAQHLRDEQRDVWVLDLRSSVGNEPMRRSDEAALWTVDSVARDDIPTAIDEVIRQTGAEKVDVIAHCMGAVMFCFAALGSTAMIGTDKEGKPYSKVRAVVLSQVGPLARLSPLNRLRGYLASYVQQFLGIDEFDTSPEFESQIDEHNNVKWKDTTASTGSRRLRDLLAHSFPYPADDDEYARFKRLPRGSDFRSVRHRADMIFGQLFELKNVADETLKQLDALFGWVKVKMLAQAIHFARHNMLTDEHGRNALFDHALFKDRFSFPVLMLHGRRNRVFDWRGSLESLKMLMKLRGEQDVDAEPKQIGQIAHYGAGTTTQLAVIDGYGHLDCIIGEHADRDVFPTLSAFFDSQVANHTARAVPPPPQYEPPWIGPMLGWVRRHHATAKGVVLQASVLVTPPPRRARQLGVLIVPVVASADGPKTLDRLACVLRPSGPRWQHLSTMPPAGNDGALRLVFNPDRLGPGFDTFAVLTIHDDISLSQKMSDLGLESFSTESSDLGDESIEVREAKLLDALPTSKEWLLGAAEPNDAEKKELHARLEREDADQLLRGCVFTMSEKVSRAADTGHLTPRDKPLCFALASCQYPPGLLDELPAGAAYRLMQADAQAIDGPQFALLVGDQVYADATAGVFEPTVIGGAAATPSRADFDRIYELNWRMPAMRRTAARLPMLTMLDDHEVADNWRPGQPRRGIDSGEALKAFERYQQVLNPPRPISTPATRSYSMFPGGVPFWVLDTRTAREPRQIGPGGPYTPVEHATILHADDMNALCHALAKAPPEVVKFIASPAPLLPPERHDRAAPEERLRSDTWAGYPASAHRLLDFIRTNNIRRVVVLAGDAHLSSVSSFTFENTDHAVISIVSSGLYTPWPFANQKPRELVLEGRHDVGSAASPCVGNVVVQAISAEAGYALVRVTATDGHHNRLHVTLRTARGTSIQVELPLT